jgi:hypothetical protein
MRPSDSKKLLSKEDLDTDKENHVLKELFSQQTGVAEQESPPTPMTEIGSQVRPTRAFTSWTTMPKRLMILLAAALSAFSTLLQH